MSEQAVRITGLREMIRAADRCDRSTKKRVRDRLRRVGEIVRDDARPRFAPVDARTAGRFRVSVRATGLVSVEQPMRKTTGQHPEFGALQMRRALVPALAARSADAEREMVAALDELRSEFRSG